jgi:peptidoglycan/LPS O-acetylase OafA/YrhL
MGPDHRLFASPATVRIQGKNTTLQDLNLPVLHSETCLPARDSKDVATSWRLPSLDGWRALSILLVIGDHTAQFPGVPSQTADWLLNHSSGFLGVRFFFTISGFLITYLMCVEQGREGRVDLKRFYLRRVLRIFPVYLAFLLVLFTLQCAGLFQQSTVTWLANITFTTNYWYSNAESAHLWSLAVEEQFYLLWPMIFIWLPIRNRVRVAIWMVCGAVGVAIGNRMLWGSPIAEAPVVGVLFQKWSFLNNVDALAIGCATAMLSSGRFDLIASRVGTRSRLFFSAAAAMVLIPHLAGTTAMLNSCPHVVRTGMWLSGYTLQSCGMAILILHSILYPKWGVYRLLNLRFVAAVGVLSYSLYIWQQPFAFLPFIREDLFGPSLSAWFNYRTWFLPAIVVALISYYGLERPFLRLRQKFR